MQINTRINAMAERAASINLTLAEVCREAGVHFSTIQRWRKGESEPKVSSFERIMGKLDRVLTEQEARILKTLNCSDGRSNDLLSLAS